MRLRYKRSKSGTEDEGRSTEDESAVKYEGQGILDECSGQVGICEGPSGTKVSVNRAGE